MRNPIHLIIGNWNQLTCRSMSQMRSLSRLNLEMLTLVLNEISQDFNTNAMKFQPI